MEEPGLGLSGARFTRLGQYMVKAGDEGKVGARVQHQGEWLQQNACLALPRVHLVLRDAYIMEMLTPAVHISSYDEYARVAIDLLYEHIWPLRHPHHEMEIDMRVALLSQYALSRIKVLPDDLSRHYFRILGGVRNEPVRAVCTHGDPTLANLMMRAYSQPVLIDPLPPSDDLPDVRAKDLGKILQSCLGFEVEIFGVLMSHDTDATRKAAVETVLSVCRNDSEVNAALAYAILHVARALPYMHGSDKATAIPPIMKGLYELVRL